MKNVDVNSRDQGTSNTKEIKKIKKTNMTAKGI